MIKVQMHRTRHKISDLAGWSNWSNWEEGFGKTDDPTFEIEIENRVFFTGPEMQRGVLDKPAQVGSVIFREGVSTDTVILAAQRYYAQMIAEAPPATFPAAIACQCANTITDPCIVCGKGKTLVTAEWVQKMAAREGDLDPTTGTPALRPSEEILSLLDPIGTTGGDND